jgi:hypothetical protein
MGKYNRFCSVKPVRFYGDVNYVYDFYCEPCTWTVLHIEKRKKDEEPPKFRGKGHLIGLTVFDILELLSGNYDQLYIEFIYNSKFKDYT